MSECLSVSCSCGKVKRFTDQDLRELGWVKAEPTDCLKCEHWKAEECQHKDHALEGVNSEMDDISNEVCLDFVPRLPKKSGVIKVSGKQEHNTQPVISVGEAHTEGLNSPAQKTDRIRPKNKNGLGGWG